MKTVVELMIVALRLLTDFNLYIYMRILKKKAYSNSLDNYTYLVPAVLLVHFLYLLKMGSALQQYRL